VFNNKIKHNQKHNIWLMEQTQLFSYYNRYIL